MIETADVLVLGLGPAGAAAAAQAARRGARVIALDRKREPGRPVQCAEFVPALVGTLVAGLGASVRQPIHAMATFVEDDAADVQDNFRGQMLDRAAFDAALVQEAVRAGAECRFGLHVSKLVEDGTVQLSNQQQLRAASIVGADGPRSAAGCAIGSVNRDLVETRQVTVELKKPHAATDIFLSAAIPGGYGWLFPKRDVANLGAGVSTSHKRQLKDIVARLHAQTAAEGRVGFDVLGMTGGAIPVGGLLRSYAVLGKVEVLLAGDAAGLANPITGAGIAAAVHSGRLAGDAAATGAGAQYQEELEDLFGLALERAVRRRRELLNSTCSKSALRRAWIAYPEYWQ